LLRYLEESKLSYIVVARITPVLKWDARRVKEWRALDATYSVKGFSRNFWDGIGGGVSWRFGRKCGRASTRWD
jgi:hypothetical protein